MPDLLRGVPNLLLLWYRRHYWRFHPARYYSRSAVTIDRPIFLVGLQGGGLTLLARMLRRHPDVVSVTGNHKYWAGPDEMQNVMGSFLPADLSGLHARRPANARYPYRDWLYAIDDLLPQYRRTAREATQGKSARFKKAIGLALRLHADDLRSARFIDKSQTYTVRVSFIQELLREQEPYFVLVTRNPYALCLRAARHGRDLIALDLSLSERLELAAQHWANSISCALEDAPQVTHFYPLRFEDLLQEPRKTLQALCDFLELTFLEKMLPHAGDRLPLGSVGSSRGDKKWYPLRPGVNRRYMERLDGDMLAIIEPRVGTLAQRFGYTPEDVQ